CPFAFKDRAVSSIASDVNSTSSFVQSASQQRAAAVPMPQQTASQPFADLLDAATSQQQTGPQANPAPPVPANRSPRQSSTVQSNNSSKSSTAAKNSGGPAPTSTSQGQKSRSPTDSKATAASASNNSKSS